MTSFAAIMVAGIFVIGFICGCTISLIIVRKDIQKRRMNLFNPRKIDD